nr:glycosyltransferase [Cohnella sp. YIM B05605]
MPLSVSVVIPARDEAGTIGDVIRSCAALRPLEIIVVANGCTDSTARAAREAGCLVVETDRPLGSDVGRAVGAAKASGDILLFVDADFPIPPRSLESLLAPIRQGRADTAYNDLDPLYREKKRPHSTTVWRRAFNVLIGRADLNIDSPLSVPHALSRAVLSAIGFECLANPAWAHWEICRRGFRIAHGFSVDVRANRYRPEQHAAAADRLSRSEKRIIGDHLAALAAARLPLRGRFGDGGRRRDLLRDFASGRSTLGALSPGRTWLSAPSRLYGGKSLSAVIPAQDEETTIRQVVREVRKIEPAEIIVVANGSKDRTAAFAADEGAKVIAIPEPLGNDVGRSVGALAATGDILLFVDGDFVLPASELFPYAHAAASGVDVALNDLNHYLDLRFPLNDVTLMKYALNLALNRKDLGVGSLIAVPHALSRQALRTVGAEALVSPGTALVKAALAGLTLKNVRRTEVDRINRIRPEQHFSTVGLPPAAERILGDHLEALHELIRIAGPRGPFPEDGRDWRSVQGVCRGMPSSSKPGFMPSSSKEAADTGNG